MRWSSNLAYIIGLITTDGNLSKDGRHINLTSKDKEQIQTFIRILNLKNKIGIKHGSFNSKTVYYQVQFGNIKFYKFLLSIGLTPNKTKTIGRLKIPNGYFADFLRGHLDGDGCTYSYWDKRWKKSFMLYTVFMSASKEHIEWIKYSCMNLYGLNGNVSFHNNSYFHLRFAKKNSIEILKLMYPNKNIPCLERKRWKIEEALDIIGR